MRLGNDQRVFFIIRHVCGGCAATNSQQSVSIQKISRVSSAMGFVLGFDCLAETLELFDEDILVCSFDDYCRCLCTWIYATAVTIWSLFETFCFLDEYGNCMSQYFQVENLLNI